jgi:hypothetical protein
VEKDTDKPVEDKDIDKGAAANGGGAGEPDKMNKTESDASGASDVSDASAASAKSTSSKVGDAKK